MNTLLVQYLYNGEKFEVWETKESTAAKALIESEFETDKGVWLYLVDKDNQTLDNIILNGGF